MATERELIYLAALLHDERVSRVWHLHRQALAGWGVTFDENGPQLSVESRDLIEQADRLACGFDRIGVTHGVEPAALVNLFGAVRVNGKPSDEHSTFGLEPLTLGEAGFPKKLPTIDLKTASEQLWKNFSAEAALLPTGSFTAFTGALFHLLRRFAWCVPASERAEGINVSLFHHLKLTAALAQCLFDQRAEPGEAFPLQLLCVDLSGIQQFIYNIGSKYAAKSLKGRSFSLQALLDGVARRLIRETQSSPSHLVYSSGGKFFMLLPNTATIAEALDRVRNEVEAAVWNEYGGGLYVCFGRVAFRYETKSNLLFTAQQPTKAQELGVLWKAVADEAAAQKQQKNRRLLLDPQQFNRLFQPSDEGGTAPQCAVTGLEGTLLKPSREKGNLRILESVNQQIEIGKALAEHEYKLTGSEGFRLLSGLDPFRLVPQRPAVWLPDHEVLKTLQPRADGGFIPETATAAETVFGFRFFGGSRVARRNLREVKNFEELTGVVREDPDDDDSPIRREACEGKFHRLGILRMDVDNLGKLFTHGFEKSKASFSAYATLSGLLDWFFSGYLNTIREREEFKNWVNIVYSGGDDVFAVGRWDRIIDFAAAVREDFGKFTGRKDLTLSAGIELVRPRFPIAKAADLAGEAEDKAKNFNKTDPDTGKKPFEGLPEKDALCLFGVVVGWEEFEAVQRLKILWTGWLDAGTLSKGVLRSLFDWYAVATARDRKTDELRNDLSWKWNAAYGLARQRTRGPSEKNAALDLLKSALFCGQYTATDSENNLKTYSLRAEALIMACRWAELAYRDSEKKES